MIVRATMTAHPMAYRDTPRAFQGSIGRPDDEALRKRRHRERRVHTAIFGICFAFFLVAAVVNRLRPSHWRRVSGSDAIDLAGGQGGGKVLRCHRIPRLNNARPDRQVQHGHSITVRDPRRGLHATTILAAQDECSDGPWAN